MLLQPHPVQEYRRLLASHLEEYDRLTRLINRLLTLARAESGDIQMRLESVDLAKLAEYLVEQLESVASSRRILLAIKSAGPVHIMGDHDWLETAILNLLDNAIKYTPEGGSVTVSVQRCTQVFKRESKKRICKVATLSIRRTHVSCSLETDVSSFGLRRRPRSSCWLLASCRRSRKLTR